jgi:hypothetical protein
VSSGRDEGLRREIIKVCAFDKCPPDAFILDEPVPGYSSVRPDIQRRDDPLTRSQYVEPLQYGLEFASRDPSASPILLCATIRPRSCTTGVATMKRHSSSSHQLSQHSSSSRAPRVFFPGRCPALPVKFDHGRTPSLVSLTARISSSAMARVGCS